MMESWSEPRPGTTWIAGRPLKCLVCNGERFEQHKAQLNTPGMTFMGLDWANKTGLCLVCTRCGYIHWFLPELAVGRGDDQW
jgi:predicted nucleic-acid-binding Zn-ribbon protein